MIPHGCKLPINSPVIKIPQSHVMDLLFGVLDLEQLLRV